jgi:hypothetical protein
MLLAEAGRATERLHAAGRERGVEVRSVHTYYDQRVDRLMGVDGVDEFCVALALVGG